MHPVIAKTFGGLSREYYFRQFIFGLIFPAMAIFMFSHGKHPIPASLIFTMVVNTFLYPYARFVYEGVVGFLLGETVFVVNAVFLLFWTLLTMTVCWSAAVFIAPIGLAYLYYHHSKNGSVPQSARH